ncbi:hypothetical protein N7495_005844 [Penicillium taxi]|uniref:uncharacterized protein n=1 Tax=Penicillium taxi TaxID=168475 RepID=UPI0025456493|nr:uncharacterized protein N7495_005844 [Penicillium taxi]KAJ5894153.1 hypothetical protein N7495_005844 [Penicillium taxi]
MVVSLTTTAIKAVAFAYGLFALSLYYYKFIRYGIFFQKNTEKQDLQLQLARDRLWNLSKSYRGLSHHFLTLQSGFKFHFVSNHTPNSSEALSSGKPVVIFIHGFPDSWAVWRHIAGSSTLQDAASIVAIDMPGYGGTQKLDKYTATNLLERLTELIIALRVQYGVDDDSGSNKKKVIIVAHDWGCVLAMRLASEAPALASRWIFSNGPLLSVVKSNVLRFFSSAQKMFKTAMRSPLNARAPLLQAIRTLRPVFRQIGLSGYIFVMQLPVPLVRFFLTGGNGSFMRSIHKNSHGRAEFTPQDAADSMASTMGPSLSESKTQTAEKETYPTTISYDGEFANIMEPANYYRHHGASARWRKSLETIANLHVISASSGRRTSNGGGLIDEGVPGGLKASATILWGEKDLALYPQICLDGFADFMVQGSQIIMLPDSGHFTPIEIESRVALEKAVQWAIEGEKGDVAAAVQVAYPTAKVTVRR